MNKEVNDDILEAVRVLQSGGVIVYPTDTIWGIGCDATNDKAVSRVYEIKKRHSSKSMIILLPDEKMIADYVSEIPLVANSLLSSIKSPLTIIYPNARNLAHNVIAPDKSVAIRIVKEEFCNMLCATFGKPLVSTSANISGFGNSVQYRDIPEEILLKADYIVKYGRGTIQQLRPSKIIKLTGEDGYEILRA